MWGSHYSALLSSNDATDQMTFMQEDIKQEGRHIKFSVFDIDDTVYGLKEGKSPRFDGLQGKHFKFAGKLYFFLFIITFFIFSCLVLSLIFIHLLTVKLHRSQMFSKGSCSCRSDVAA